MGGALTTMNSPLLPGLAAGLFAAGSWAVASQLFARLFARADAPSAAAANLFKNLLAGLLFLGLAWAFADGGLGDEDPWQLAFSGLLGFAVGDALYFAALPRCGVQTAAVIALANVPLSVAGASLFMGERVGLGTLGGGVLVLAGVLLVLLGAPAQTDGQDPAVRRRGVLLALGNVLAITTAILTGSDGMGEAGVYSAAATRLLGGVAGAFAVAVLLGLPRGRASQELNELTRPLRTTRGLLPLLIASVTGSVLGLIPYHFALQELPAGIAALVFSTTPLFTLPLGRLGANSSRPTPRQVLGTVLGFAGVAVVLACADGSGHEASKSKGTLTVVSRAEGPEGAWPRIAEGPTVLATRGGGGLFALDLHTLAVDGDALAFSARETAVEGEDWFVNWADTPALASDGSSVTWLQKVAADTYDYHVVWARRGAEGAFEEQGSLHDDEGAGEHGFCSWLSLGDGRQLALWLDGRATREGGPMQVRSRIIQADGTPEPETLVDPRACDCCPTTLALLGDGSVLAAWRDRGEDEVRDIALARWTEAEGWTAPFFVHEDGWRIPGCPVNGPVLAARGSRVALAWYTQGSDEAPRIWCVQSEDGGETFGEPVRVDGGAALGQLDLAWSEGGSLLASWHEGAPGAASWQARVLHPQVGQALQVAPTTGGRGDGRARLLGLEDSWLLVWSTAESPRTLAAARLAER
jgi:drug/metabolite transporter (DMT)-like permease